MVYSTHLWWFWGWCIIVLSTLVNVALAAFGSPRSEFQSLEQRETQLRVDPWMEVAGENQDGSGEGISTEFPMGSQGYGASRFEFPNMTTAPWESTIVPKRCFESAARSLSISHEHTASKAPQGAR